MDAWVQTALRLRSAAQIKLRLWLLVTVGPYAVSATQHYAVRCVAAVGATAAGVALDTKLKRVLHAGDMVPPSPGTSSQLCPLLLESNDFLLPHCCWIWCFVAPTAAGAAGETGPGDGGDVTVAPLPTAVSSTVLAVRSKAATGGSGDAVPADMPLLDRLPLFPPPLLRTACCCCEVCCCCGGGCAPGAAPGEWWR